MFNYLFGGLCVILCIGLIYGLLAEKKETPKNKISFFETFRLTGYPLVTFSINGHKVNFLLDTGSEVSYLDTNIIDIVGAERVLGMHNYVIGGVGGEKIETSYLKAVLEYRGEEFPFIFQGFDFNTAMAQSKEALGIPIQGILGSDFFVKYKYKIDFKNLIAYSQK